MGRSQVLFNRRHHRPGRGGRGWRRSNDNGNNSVNSSSTAAVMDEATAPSEPSTNDAVVHDDGEDESTMWDAIESSNKYVVLAKPVVGVSSSAGSFVDEGTGGDWPLAAAFATLSPSKQFRLPQYLIDSLHEEEEDEEDDDHDERGEGDNGAAPTVISSISSGTGHGEFLPIVDTYEVETIRQTIPEEASVNSATDISRMGSSAMTSLSSTSSRSQRATIHQRGVEEESSSPSSTRSDPIIQTRSIDLPTVQPSDRAQPHCSFGDDPIIQRLAAVSEEDGVESTSTAEGVAALNTKETKSDRIDASRSLETASLDPVLSAHGSSTTDITDSTSGLLLNPLDPVLNTRRTARGPLITSDSHLSPRSNATSAAQAQPSPKADTSVPQSPHNKTEEDDEMETWLDNALMTFDSGDQVVQTQQEEPDPSPTKKQTEPNDLNDWLDSVI